MLEQNEDSNKDELENSFVTIRIFARTEPKGYKAWEVDGFVTIRIFARTEHEQILTEHSIGFVTIRIFARTEQRIRNEYN